MIMRIQIVVATESVPQCGSVWLDLEINSYMFENYRWPHIATRYRAVVLTRCHNDGYLVAA